MFESLNRVIIFDWDDTICPSSFVDQWKVESCRDLPLHFQNLFDEVAKHAEKCLNEAAKYGEVILITNSDDGWVKFSAERFVPRLLPCLERFRIVSARTRYERFYPNQPLCWKAAAFAHEVNEIYSANMMENKLPLVDPGEDDIASLVSTEGDSNASTSLSSLTDDFASVIPYKNRQQHFTGRTRVPVESKREVVSFGDSMEERTAVQIVASQLKATSKSVMFINSPTPIQIIGQLSVLTENMENVCNHEKTLDLEISPRQAIQAAEELLHDTHNRSRRPPHSADVDTKYANNEMDAISRLRRVSKRSNDIRITSNQGFH